MRCASTLDAPIWLSAHLYCGCWIYTRAFDAIVLEVAEPFVQRCRRRSWVDGHFFVRYTDGDPHLRLRLHGGRSALEERVWPDLEELVRRRAPAVVPVRSPKAAQTPQAALAAIGVTRVLRAEYEPEVARYGGPAALPAAERMFQISSQAAGRLLAQLGSDDRAERLGKGLLAMAVLLRVFLPERRGAAAFALGYGEHVLRSRLGEVEARGGSRGDFERCFLRQSSTIEAAVNAIWTATGPSALRARTLSAYATGATAVRDELQGLCRAGRIVGVDGTAPDWRGTVLGILPSHVHMMSNRLGIAVYEESYLAHLLARTLGREAPGSGGALNWTRA